MKRYIPMLLAASLLAGCSDTPAQPAVHAETPDTAPAVVTTAPVPAVALAETTVSAVNAAAEVKENPFGKFSVTEEDFDRLTDDDIRKIYYSGLRTEDFVDDFYVLPYRDELYRIVYVPESREYDGFMRIISADDPKPVSTELIEENDLYTAFREEYESGEQQIWLKPKDLRLIWDQSKRFVGEYDDERVKKDIDLLRQQDHIILARELKKTDGGYVYSYIAINKGITGSEIELTWWEQDLFTKSDTLYKKPVLKKGRRVRDTITNDSNTPPVSIPTGIPASSLPDLTAPEEETEPKPVYEKAVFERDVYDNGCPEYNDKSAIKDITMSAERENIMTDDKGEGKCGVREDFFYASIPVGDDMPERIEFKDIDTGEFVGYMYDDGNTAENGDEKAGDGIYSIRMLYEIDIDRDPDVSDSWSRCYFGVYTDSQGTKHTCGLPVFVNVNEPLTEKELAVWDIVTERMNEIQQSEEYKSATTDEKEKMLLDELDKLADEGYVYRDLTRTNNTPRNVVFKIVKGPTMIIELEPCACGYGEYGYDTAVCDTIE
ncbi:MAG: hypothetical protein ILP19_07005 [Oscillospiraceae bacterium]|nr:hypothetical protein [Oscillospiraceae bacterium]